jgi:hypothetical protein
MMVVTCGCRKSGKRREYIQMGRILLSVQSMSMLPCGQPEPPETTLVILNDDGAGEESGTGLETEVATRAIAVNRYLMVECDVEKV